MAEEPLKERRSRHITIWVTATLDRRIERRIRRLPHEPTKSAWCQLVIRRELDRLEREAERSDRDPPAEPGSEPTAR